MTRALTPNQTVSHCCAAFILVLSMLTAAHAQLRPPNPHAQEPIGTVRQVYDGALMPDIQVNTFRNIDRLFPTRVVERGATVYPLPYSDHPVTALSFESGGRTYDLFEYLSLNRIGGIVAIRNGEIIYETYQLGNTNQTRWMSMSMVKSITATLVGAAIAQGHIDSLDDLVTRYLPALAGGAYDGVTIRQLLEMTSGVAWNETYTDPQSDRRRMLEAQIAQQPGSILALMSALDRAAEPGARWNYSTGETQVVGALVSAATKQPLAEYLSERIWARFGMEADATWWLESPGGLEIGGSGLSAVLRDYARFGLFLLDGGVAGGEQVLPPGWMREAGSARVVGGETVHYGYMFWPVEPTAGSVHEGAYEAYGIYNQRIYVNPRENLVVALWSAWPKPQSTVLIDDLDFFAALATVAPGATPAAAAAVPATGPVPPAEINGIRPQ